MQVIITQLNSFNQIVFTSVIAKRT